MIIKSYQKSVNPKEMFFNYFNYLCLFLGVALPWKREPSQYYWHFGYKSLILILIAILTPCRRGNVSINQGSGCQKIEPEVIELRLVS